MNQVDWLRSLSYHVVRFLWTLQVPDRPGRFLPCVDGATELGKQVALGFSCFAVKIYYTLGLWEELQPRQREAWIAFLKSFQVDGNTIDDPIAHNAFLDPPVVHDAYSRIPRSRRLLHRVFPPKSLTHPQRVIIAETKQTIATLAQVGESAKQPYRGFPVTATGVRNHLLRLDWTKPWGAGGQAAALVVFLKTQSPRFLGDAEVQGLLDVCAQFFESLVDVQTGAYFRGGVPGRGELINGAMKVLTALDWLEVPIHYPEGLIDTCLEGLPSSEGCHLVDAVYVLYRCSQQTRYKRAKIQAYCAQVLDMIKRHHNPDGGFSYDIGRSQTTYYGVPIAQGLDESDIHGTCLLAWAVAMILEILDSNPASWQVIKP